ncbi:MAG: hypothetical protein WDN06_01820 [Asticcacaulis sp.]
MNAGGWDRGGVTQTLDLVNGQHLLSTRQFRLDLKTPEAAWPDIDIVVPFHERIADASGRVQGLPVAQKSSGDYKLTQAIDRIEIFDEIRQQPVPGVTAVWEDEVGDAGAVDRAILHILGTDPFAWITPQVSSWSTASPVPPQSYIQFFGAGPDMAFSAPRRFGRLGVEPKVSAGVGNDFDAALHSRVLNAHGATLRFYGDHNAPVKVDQIDLYLIYAGLSARYGPMPAASGIINTWDLPGGYKLVQIRRDLGDPTAAFDLAALGQDMPVYAVAFRTAPATFTVSGQRTLLLPGKYTVHVEGTTSATCPLSKDIFQYPVPVKWYLHQTFETTWPFSARSYICYATLRRHAAVLPAATAMVIMDTRRRQHRPVRPGLPGLSPV